MKAWPTLLAAMAAALCIAAASDPADRLADPAAEARARGLFEQVRCLVCQNESIDDSDAALAHDLRQIVREQVKAGRSDAQIRHFLTDRYGEFVLLKPAFSWGNAALWLIPFLAVAGGVLLLRRQLRSPPAEAELSQDEALRLAQLSEDDFS